MFNVNDSHASDQKQLLSVGTTLNNITVAQAPMAAMARQSSGELGKPPITGTASSKNKLMPTHASSVKRILLIVRANSKRFALESAAASDGRRVLLGHHCFH